MAWLQSAQKAETQYNAWHDEKENGNEQESLSSSPTSSNNPYKATLTKLERGETNNTTRSTWHEEGARYDEKENGNDQL